MKIRHFIPLLILIGICLYLFKLTGYETDLKTSDGWNEIEWYNKIINEDLSRSRHFFSMSVRDVFWFAGYNMGIPFIGLCFATLYCMLKKRSFHAAIILFCLSFVQFLWGGFIVSLNILDALRRAFFWSELSSADLDSVVMVLVSQIWVVILLCGFCTGLSVVNLFLAACCEKEGMDA